VDKTYIFLGKLDKFFRTVKYSENRGYQK